MQNLPKISYDNTHTYTHQPTCKHSTHISHKPSSTHGELLLCECFKWKQSCWEICVETYAAVGVAEALIRLRNVVLDPPSKPSSYTHRHTKHLPPRSRNPTGCARRCLSCKPLEMCAWNSSRSGEINRNLTVVIFSDEAGVNLWVGSQLSGSGVQQVLIVLMILCFLMPTCLCSQKVTLQWFYIVINNLELDPVGTQ